MPFKTKKRKTRAEKKRVEISQEGLAIYRSSDKIQIDQFEAPKSTPEKRDFSGQSYSYVKGELTRILILALIIIGLQVTLKIINITF